MFVPFADLLNHSNVQVTFDIYVKENLELPAQHMNETHWDTHLLNRHLLDEFHLYSDELTRDNDPPEFQTWDEKFNEISKFSDFKFAVSSMT